MRSLREIQAQCMNAFLVGDDRHLRRALRHDIRPAAIQIAVYQNNARETYRQALYASFPVVSSLVGGDCFSGLAEMYRRDYPSTSGDLMEFGKRFPELLDGLYAETVYAYLPDVARLEWACEEVLANPEGKRIRPDRLRSLSADAYMDIRFTVTAQARLIRSEFPILEIWRAHQSADPDTVDLNHGPDHIVISRRQDDALLKRISPGAFDLALTLRSGVALGDAFEEWTEQYISNDFGRAFEELFATGVLSDFYINKR